jgi:hypothetical protein
MMLVERAAEKPSMLKLSSVAVHSARPAMMGNRERFTHNPSEGNRHTKRMVSRSRRRKCSPLCERSLPQSKQQHKAPRPCFNTSSKHLYVCM